MSFVAYEGIAGDVDATERFFSRESPLTGKEIAPHAWRGSPDRYRVRQRMKQEILDSVIIGGGPAGLAVAHSFQGAGLRYRLLEKGPIAHHIAQYPTFMRFFSTNKNLEIAGFPLGISEEKPSRRDYLLYLTQFAQYHRLAVQTHTEVTGAARRADGLFEVGYTRTSIRPNGSAPNNDGPSDGFLLSRSVVAAVGAWDQPRRLSVPGADLPKVHERFYETHEYVGKKVLVVGGRNSAVETALLLWRAGAEVSLCYRGREFNGVGLKYWLRPDIENRLANGEITGHLGAHVSRIDRYTVSIRGGDGSTVEVANDFVLPMLGYDPPVDFLRRLGIALEAGTNRPGHDAATLETNVPGLFVAGVITNGNISGHVFIENSRHHGDLILKGLGKILATPPPVPVTA